jgi:hypothetical protein
MEDLSKKMPAFPRGEARRKLIEDNENKIEEFKRVGVKKIQYDEHYKWTDSPLDGHHGSSFYHAFVDFLPREGRSLRHFIETTLEKKKGHAVGVEFGGVGVQLFKGFSDKFFEQTVGVTLVDYRFKIDNRGSHKVLEGDIFDNQTYKELEKILDGKKIDLIIERMQNGLEFVPIEPFYVSKFIERWYNMLSDNGMMMVQVPAPFRELLEKMAVYLNAHYAGVIEFKIGESTKHPTFMLRKLEGAPATLPLLPAREVISEKKDKGENPT